MGNGKEMMWYNETNKRLEGQAGADVVDMDVNTGARRSLKCMNK